MDHTEYYVTKTAGASVANAGSSIGEGPGENDGPLFSAADAVYVSAYHIGKGAVPFSGLSAGMHLMWNPGGANEIRRIIAWDANDIEVQVAITDPAAPATVNVGGAWATVDFAMSVTSMDLISVDPIRVNIGPGPWLEECEIVNAGDHDNAITYEGFFATPGDGGLDGNGDRAVIIDGADVTTPLRECITTALPSSTYGNLDFVNIHCKRSTTAGFEMRIRACTYKNCEASLNTLRGIYGYTMTNVIGGSYHDNTSDGLNIHADSFVSDVNIYDNTGYGVNVNNVAVIEFCRIIGNGHGILMYVATGNAVIRNCTIDNETTTGYGIRLYSSGTSAHRPTIINTIITRCATGLDGASLDTSLAFGHSNLLHANTANYANWALTDDDLTGDPVFEDPDNGDYNIEFGSPATGAAYGSGDIGAMQRTEYSLAELHLVKALLANKAEHTVATGKLKVYDDDGSTELVTITPSEVGGVVTLTPAVASSGTPGDMATELRLIKAALLNVRTHDVASGVDVIMDDDGQTPLVTLTPSEPAPVVTRTPS